MHKLTVRSDNTIEIKMEQLHATVMASNRLCGDVTCVPVLSDVVVTFFLAQSLY